MHHDPDCPNHPDNLERPDAAPPDDGCRSTIQLEAQCTLPVEHKGECDYETPRELAPPPSDAAPVAWTKFDGFVCEELYDWLKENVTRVVSTDEEGNEWSASLDHLAHELTLVALSAWAAAHPEDAPPLEELGRLQCAECASKGVRRQPCIHISQVYDSGKRIGHIEARHGYDPEDAPGGPWEVERTDRRWAVINKKERRELWPIPNEAEAIAVRDALNRLKGDEK
jgi:hypothetical protein